MCDGNKASFQRTPSYRSVPRLIQLITGNFAYSAFNTLSLKFSQRTLLALFTATTLAIPGLRIRLSMVLLLQEGIWVPTFFMLFESSGGVLDLVGGRVHLDDSDYEKGRSEMPFCLKHLWFLNLAAMSKFVLNKLVNLKESFSHKATPKSNILLVFLAPFVL
ncbi:hypothetical protein TNCV_3023521 [Trichonephila clavipes]|nr:hypothetical protein TNCV_3023521 [Trichonephila clavipes]